MLLLNNLIFKKIFSEINKNILFTFLIFLLIKRGLFFLDENYANLKILFIFTLFTLSSVFYIIICKTFKKNISLILTLVFILTSTILINNTFLALLFFSLFLAIIFYLIDNFFNFTNKFNNYFSKLILFFSFSTLIPLLTLIKINYSIDEGFLLLFLFLYLIYVFFLFFSLSLSKIIWNKKNIQKKVNKKNNKLFFLFTFFIIIFQIIIFTLAYWNSLDLYSDSLNMSQISEHDIFQKIDLWSNNNFKFSTSTNPTKQNLIKYIKDTENNTIDKFGCLFVLSGDKAWGEKFKTNLLEEANKHKFLNSGGSVKAWQFNVSTRSYFYLRSKEINPNLFNQQENETILNWFKSINEYAYKITLADYSYAYLFKQKPIGFYYNQEIGFGMLALFYHIFKDTHPDLATKNKNIINNYAVGWENNFKNTDDGIMYHQDLWLKNAYFLYKYANIGNLNNAKLSFDWILYQNPYQSGIHPNYNTQNNDPALSSMLIGAQLLKNGEYKNTANHMLEYIIKNKIPLDNYVGLDLWNDDIHTIQPKINSYYIKSTSGTNANPKKLQADKLVLRKIINKQELFILINLRSSGWHRYNGSGSIIMVKYGNKILLKDKIINKNHYWLPKGKAGHRDKKITNKEINIYQKKSEGIEKLFYYLFSFDDSLAFQNNDKFINEFIIKTNTAEIKINKNDSLFINTNNNILQIYYNQNKKLLDLKLTNI